MEGKKNDSNKLRYDLLSAGFTEGMVKVLTLGAIKYDDNNWLNVRNGVERYYAASMRHLQAWRLGEELDKESGYHHLYHVATNLMFIVELTK